jgi:hypothetical protein
MKTSFIYPKIGHFRSFFLHFRSKNRIFRRKTHYFALKNSGFGGFSPGDFVDDAEIPTKFAKSAKNDDGGWETVAPKRYLGPFFRVFYAFFWRENRFFDTKIGFF